MKTFRCKECGSHYLEITYDATVTYQALEILKDDIHLSRHGDYDCEKYGNLAVILYLFSPTK